jgi:hypothetical protein
MNISFYEQEVNLRREDRGERIDDPPLSSLLYPQIAVRDKVFYLYRI